MANPTTLANRRELDTASGAVGGCRAADRIPKQRYYDPDFYALEAELFWPRVWQMACRLEEIPKPGDFVEYEILDESIIVVRVDSRNRAGVPQRMPPPRGKAGGRQRKSADLRLPVPRLVLGHRRPQHVRVATRGVRRGEHVPRRPATRLGQVRALGRMRVDQPRRQRPAVARLPWSRSRRSTTPGRWNRCASNGGNRAGCR